MKKFLAGAFAAFGLLSGSFAAAAEPAPQKLTFFHWWTSPSESAALNALIKLFSQKYPDVTVFSAPAPGAANIRALFPILKRLESEKQPPDAFQMNAGYAAQVFFDAGLLAPIDDLWASEKLDEVIPPVIRDLNKFEGHYYSVPVNVHRTNVVWYNKPLLDKNGIDPETLTTWDAFFKAVQTIKANGVASPIQVGSNWTANLAFECIVASEGIAVYEDWINGKITAVDDPRLAKALNVFGKYLSFVNKDHGEVTWDAAVRRVMKGEGAFIIMGDYANGEFRVAHMKYGHDYGTILVPGTKGMFGLGIDTFQHPRGIADQTSSMRWLKLAASREGQDAFNPLKGSISARNDSDITKYDPYQRTAIADLKVSKALYPTIGSAVPEAFNSRVGDTLVAFMADQDVEKAATSLAKIAASLAGRYSRTWALK
jgi:glucose/mannose transport system substrate-binding protein